MHLAFVTYAKQPLLTEDDQLLVQYLAGKRIKVTPAIWDNATIDWRQFDAIVLRSTWDYFERPAEFNKWLDKLALLKCTVLNPLSVIKWNQDKQYFNDFSQRGFALPPYVICSQKSTNTLVSVLKENGWEKAVVKPAISGGAYNTFVTTASSASNDESRFTVLLQTGDIIVQRFVEEIITKGELSLIFFNKKFSHAICKKAKAGDFRIQTQFGGTAEPTQPDKALLTKATELLMSIPESLLYSRVDGVVMDNGEFLLMELELIEPSLSLYTNADACENFYHALLELMITINAELISS